MVDNSLRGIERAFRASPGDLSLKMRLISHYVRSERLLDALPLCKEILSVCKFASVEYKFVRNILVSHGIFILFHQRGSGKNDRDVFSLFSVPCSVPNFKNNKFLNWTNLKLDFTWDKKRLTKRFTQDRIVSTIKDLESANLRDSRVLPSAMYYHWCVRFVLSLPEEYDGREAVLDLFKSDFENYVLTSTRVFYGKKKIEHLYKMPDSPVKMIVPFELMGSPEQGYLRDLQENDEGLNIARAVLGADDESIIDLDQLYETLGASQGVWLWRSNQSGERAVGLSFVISNFVIVAYFIIDRRCRLVVARQVN